MTEASGRPERRLYSAIFALDAPPTATGARRTLLLAVMTVVGAALSFLRTPSESWNILWAEDGAVFVSDALRGDPAVILEPYSGYLHLIPRLLAQIATLVPLDAVPLAVTILAALATGILGSALFVFLEQHIAAIPIRFGVWLAFIAAPLAGGEVGNSIANLHWLLLVVAFCATASRARSTGMAVAQAAVLVAAVTSDPLALLLFPLLLVRLVAGRDRRDLVIVAAFATGAAVQIGLTILGTLINDDRTWSDSRPGPSLLLEFYTIRVIMTGVVGVSGTLKLVPHLGAVASGLALAAAALLFVLVGRRDRSRRIPIVVFASASFIFATLVYTLQWDNLGPVGALRLQQGDRYSIVALLLLVVALAMCADAAVASVSSRSLRLGAALVVLALLAVPVGIDFRGWNVRGEAPAWHLALTDAAAACRAGEDEDGTVRPTIAPSFIPGPAIPCDKLEESR